MPGSIDSRRVCPGYRAGQPRRGIAANVPSLITFSSRNHGRVYTYAPRPVPFRLSGPRPIAPRRIRSSFLACLASPSPPSFFLSFFLSLRAPLSPSPLRSLTARSAGWSVGRSRPVRDTWNSEVTRRQPANRGTPCPAPWCTSRCDGPRFRILWCV